MKYVAAVSTILVIAGIVGAQIGVSQTSYDFGTTSTTVSVLKTFTINNQSSVNTYSITVTGLNTPFSISPPTIEYPLAPNTGRICTLTFAPKSASQYSATLQIYHSASTPANPINIPLTGVCVVSSPSSSINMTCQPSIAFGSVAVGQSSSTPLTMTNLSTSTSALTVSPGNLSSPFSISPTGSRSISPNSSFTWTVNFLPTSAVSYVQTLSMQNNATNSASPFNVSLSGSGKNTPTTINISFSPDSIYFGDIPVGRTATQSAVFNNLSTSTSNLVITVYPLSSPFATTNTTYTIAPGNTKTISLTFSPTSSGLYGQYLRIDQNASNKTSPSYIAVTGKSTAPQPTTLTITADKVLYNLGDHATFTIKVSDQFGNPMSGQSIGIYDPDTNLSICPLVNSNQSGIATYTANANQTGYLSYSFFLNSLIYNYIIGVKDQMADVYSSIMNINLLPGLMPGLGYGYQPTTSFSLNDLVSVTQTTVSDVKSSIPVVVGTGACATSAGLDVAGVVVPPVEGITIPSTAIICGVTLDFAATTAAQSALINTAKKLCENDRTLTSTQKQQCNDLLDAANLGIDMIFIWKDIVKISENGGKIVSVATQSKNVLATIYDVSGGLQDETKFISEHISPTSDGSLDYLTLVVLSQNPAIAEMYGLYNIILAVKSSNVTLVREKHSIKYQNHFIFTGNKISINTKGSVSLQIYSPAGQLIAEKHSSNGQINYDLNVKGVFLCKMKNENIIDVKKFVVVK
jgi:hypothetical protein